MRILDRYVAKLLARDFLYALGALVTIFSVITLTEELRASVPPRYGIGSVLVYVLLGLPTEAYGLFPASALLGAILTLGRMLQDQEIVAVHAAGISPRRFAAAVLSGAALIGIAGVPFGEWIAAPLSQVGRSRRALALSEGRMLNTVAGTWIRDGNQIIQIGEVRPDGSLSSVVVFELEEGRRLSRVLQAERATSSADVWTLHNLRESTITPQGVRTQRSPRQTWAAKLTMASMRALWLKPEDLSLRDLSYATAWMRRQHLNTLAYEIAWLRRASAPIYIVLMVGLALAIVTGTGQRRLFGERLALGAFAGLGFQLFQQMFTNFGVTAGLPSVVTALAPAGIVLSATLLLWRVGGGH